MRFSVSSLDKFIAYKNYLIIYSTIFENILFNLITAPLLIYLSLFWMDFDMLSIS